MYDMYDEFTEIVFNISEYDAISLETIGSSNCVERTISRDIVLFDVCC